MSCFFSFTWPINMGMIITLSLLVHIPVMPNSVHHIQTHTTTCNWPITMSLWWQQNNDDQLNTSTTHICLFGIWWICNTEQITDEDKCALSLVNMALSAFAAVEHRAAVPCCLLLPIDIYCPHGTKQQTTRPLHRPQMWAVPITALKKNNKM